MQLLEARPLYGMTFALTFVVSGLAMGIGKSPNTTSQDLRTWTVPAAPVLRIGDEGISQTQFSAPAVARAPSGEIVVVNTRTQELRVFSRSGAFLSTMSRQGSGPGEIQSPFVTLARSRDTVFVLERPPGPSQVHVFVVPGGFRTRIPLRVRDVPRGGANATARLSSGQFLVATGGFRAIGSVAVGEIIHDSISLGILTAGDPGAFVSLGKFPSSWRFGYALASIAGQTGIATYSLGPSTVTGVSGDRVWIGDSGTGEITILDSGGVRVTTVRLPIRPRPFSAAGLEAAKKRALESAANADDRARHEALYSPGLLPRMAPFFARFVAGVDGEMWVQLFDEDTSAPTRFIVLDKGGRPLARAVLPSRLRVDDVGQDYLLGVHADQDGVERVVQFRLER